MWDLIRQKLHSAYLGRLCRRGVALTLALSMSLPMVAFADGEGPVAPVPPAEDMLHPTITIEANAVVDRWYDPTSSAMDVRDYLTGDLEVAVRVKTGKLAEGAAAFNTIGVALQYSSILTPYKWTLINGIDLSGKTDVTAQQKKDAAQPVDLTATIEPFEEMANMQTLKSKQITDATGQVSGKEGEGGYLYIRAHSDRPIELEEDTVLAVVTFRYDLEKYPIVAAEAEQWLTPTVVTPPSGGDDDGGDTETLADEGDYDCLLQFAPYVGLDGRYMGTELWYNATNYNMYYTEGTVPVMGTALTLSEDYTQIEENKINFSLVNQTTYNDGGLTLDDLATVLFYDWDDTLIGVLIVPRDGDARKLVNDYVRDHLIHPDLRGNKNVSSLAREDNYRGKYSSSPGEETYSDGTEDSGRSDGLLGKDYPLTNKLDYVFMKRPMERVTEDENGDPITTNTWRQKGTEEAMQWDEDYPYIHGWAKLEDKNWNHPSTMWTTMGTAGELNSYTGMESIRIPGVGVEKNVISANVTSTDPNFRFADFDFRVKNNNSRDAGSVYSVKAIYEPGIDLMGEVAYRMISQPYYDKLNSNQASGGGAYNVDLLFERSYLDEGILYGVTRARDLMLRQETTSDIRWEGEELVNATILDQSLKTKTTYTNVSVKNVEEVAIQLVLSARQNKVDYYLMEGFGASFVTGGERSIANSLYFDNDHTWDSYNYRVDDSELGDIYYDTPYGDRDGSHGFVLYGTLNSILRITSQYILDGEQDDADFNVYVTEDTLRDLNLRYPNNSFVTLDGDEETIGRYLKMVEAIQAAVRSAVTAHRAGDNTWWNKDPDRNWADMTYHQLQHFVIDYIQDGSAILMSKMDAEAKSISWCHYHEECAAKASGKPRNWEELVRTAQGYDGNNKPVDSREKITLLTLEEIEAIAHIRADDKGSAFADNGAFADAFVLAVRSGNTTWDQIQDYIIRKQADAEWSQKNYWWYDGSTRVSFASLTDTVAAARDAYTPTKAPGDSAGVKRTAKINQLKKIFEENQSSTTVTTDWNNATKNLCDGNEGDKFTDFEDFRNKFVLAAEAVVGAVGELEFDSTDTIATMTAKTRAYWDKLQYHILNGSYVASHPDMETYWWYDGNSKIGDLASLLAAAQRQVELDDKGNGEIDTIFNLFSLTDLYTLTDLHFRSNFHGDEFTDIGTFKDVVKKFVTLGNVVVIADADSSSANKTNCWNQLQYYLIHSGDTGFTSGAIKSGASGERTYYWWRNGADGEEYAFGKTASKNPGPDDAWTLLEAVYRYEINGNTKAYEQLTPELMAGFRLVSSYTTEGTWDDLPKYGESDISGLKTTLKALYDAVVLAGDDYKTVTWRQVQHYLLGKGYVTKAQLAGDDSLIPSDNKADKNGYWWKEGQTKPSGGKPPTALDDFLAEIDKYIQSDTLDDSHLETAVDNYVLNDALELHGGSVTKTGHKVMSKITVAQKSAFKKKIVALAKTIKKAVKDKPLNEQTCVGILDWYVLQYYAIHANAYSEGDPIKDHDFAVDYYTGTLVDKCGADWVPDDYRVAATSSLAMMAMFMMAAAPGPDTLVETDPDTGVTTVTTVVETDLEETETTLIVTTVVAIDPAGTTTTTTTTTLMDWDGNILSETVTTSVQETEPAESVEPTESPEPTETPEPTESPASTESPAPTETPEPTETPDPTVGADVPIGPTPEPTGGDTLETVPEIVDAPLISTENDGTIENQADPADPPEEEPPQTGQQEKGGDDTMTTMINNRENVSKLSSALLPMEKLRWTTSNAIMSEVIAPEGTTGIDNGQPGRLVLPGSELYAAEERLRRTPKPKIAAPPNRLISISTDLLAILGIERRA